MSWLLGAAAGWKVGQARAKRIRAERVALLRAQAERLEGRAVTPPLATENWFSRNGVFTFGLPQNYVEGPRAGWSGPTPSVLVVDRHAPTAMWLVVFENQKLTIDLDPGVSPWLAVLVPDDFRAMARKWGGTVVAGPEPILLDGEPALFAAYSMVEGGRENRKWVAATAHGGTLFEIIMQTEPHTESSYAATFWTAVGSWRWGAYHGLGPSPTQEQLTAQGSGQQPAGLLSPDGKHRWDGAQWRPV